MPAHTQRKKKRNKKGKREKKLEPAVLWLLRNRTAFAQGGRRKNDDPIIYFLANSHLGDVREISTIWNGSGIFFFALKGMSLIRQCYWIKYEPTVLFCTSVFLLKCLWFKVLKIDKVKKKKKNL